MTEIGSQMQQKGLKTPNTPKNDQPPTIMEEEKVKNGVLKSPGTAPQATREKMLDHGNVNDGKTTEGKQDEVLGSIISKGTILEHGSALSMAESEYKKQPQPQQEQ